MQKTGKCICKSSTKDAVYFNETFKGCKSSIYANITADTEVRARFSAAQFILSVHKDNDLHLFCIIYFAENKRYRYFQKTCEKEVNTI